MLDRLVTTRIRHYFVIPVKTGIKFFNGLLELWIPAFAGMTSCCESIMLGQLASGTIFSCDKRGWLWDLLHIAWSSGALLVQGISIIFLMQRRNGVL
jgi:hypothetical protein